MEVFESRYLLSGYIVHVCACVCVCVCVCVRERERERETWQDTSCAADLPQFDITFYNSLLTVSFLSCHMKFGFHANCTKTKCPTTDCT